MSIFFNNNYGLKNNIDNVPNENKPVVAGKISNLPEYISALKEGSVFKGEILDVRNNAIKILLSSNDVLNARTDGSVQLNIGDILNFKVESNTGMSMLVKAVSAGNTNGGLNMLMSALESANIPVNERNISLVKELVDNGQAIDKNTIKTLVSNLNNYSELDIKTAVTMFKHDIPITKDNVTQFNNFIENNNRLMDNFNNIPEDFVKTIIEFSSNHTETEVISFANEILSTISGDDNYIMESVVLNEQTNENMSQIMQGQEKQVVEQTDITTKNIIIDSAPEGDENVVIKSDNLIENITNISENNTNSIEHNQITNEPQIFNLDVFKNEITKLVKEKLFIDKEVFNKLENEIKEEVEKYFKEVEDKTDKILKTLENAGMEKSLLHQNVNNVKTNITFMNDLNNMALYMQLPVKFSENEAHGELYVLNRNKGKIVEKDVLTAFLHLDMENLGATDVNIRLEKEQLTTKFTLEDTISQDIVEEHLPELQKRLEEKGYSATLLVEEIKKDNDNTYLSPFEQVLSLHEPKNFIKRYTLDVRA